MGNPIIRLRTCDSLRLCFPNKRRMERHLLPPDRPQCRYDSRVVFLLPTPKLLPETHHSHKTGFSHSLRLCRYSPLHPRTPSFPHGYLMGWGGASLGLRTCHYYYRHWLSSPRRILCMGSVRTASRAAYPHGFVEEYAVECYGTSVGVGRGSVLCTRYHLAEHGRDTVFRGPWSYVGGMGVVYIQLWNPVRGVCWCLFQEEDEYSDYCCVLHW